MHGGAYETPIIDIDASSDWSQFIGRELTELATLWRVSGRKYLCQGRMSGTDSFAPAAVDYRCCSCGATLQPAPL